MNTEDKISVDSDQGRKNQWGRSLLYRQDGRKRTLNTKELTKYAFFSFACIALAIVIQGKSESAPERPGGGEISGPPPLGTQSIENVPGVEQARADRTNEKGGRDGEKTGTGKKRFLGPQLVSRPRSGKIPPGSLLKAVLLTGASNGPVRAEAAEEMRVNGETVIEAGAILLGNGESGEDRLLVRFSQIVYRDGGVGSVNAQACDWGDKIPGLKGSTVGGQATRLATGIGLNFVGGMSTGLEDTQG